MTTSPTSAGDREIDQLIPPPWSTARRVVVTAVALALVAAVVAVGRSGTVVPRLVHADGWGSAVDTTDPGHLAAQRRIPLVNAGWVDAQVSELVLPELDGVSWQEVRGLPATLGPGETHEVVVVFTVDGCEIDAQGYDEFAFVATSPLGLTRTARIPAPESTDPTLRTTYLSETGEPVTRPAWPDQPPSWILDTVHAACDRP